MKLFAVACAVLPCALASCIVVAAAAVAGATYGVIKYTENGAEADFDAELEATFAATVQAMRALDYPVAEDLKPGTTEGRIKVNDADVHVGRQPGGFTRVTVTIGTFDTEDHERRARLILEEVKKRLPSRS
ncbi:MAG: DUF3568 family protein [Planctomycetes bacterium]|nr:DUF3568 family protein [Planctomycetota bacterium]